MRTGNAIVNVIIEIVVIALVAAIAVWVLGMVNAPPIIGTIIWVLAALAIVMVLLQLLRAGGMDRRAP